MWKKASCSLVTAWKRASRIAKQFLLLWGLLRTRMGVPICNMYWEWQRRSEQHMQDYLVVATKSTVPIKTAEKVRQKVYRGLKEKGGNMAFDVASNPEFLKEGDAINDFLKPDRIVIGTDSKRAEKS
jgi:hypothetical protein